MAIIGADPIRYPLDVPVDRLVARIGLWPEPTDTEKLDAEETPATEDDIKSLLTRYGYDSRVDAKTLITAFQRHFEPEAFWDDEKVGIVTPRTHYRAKALVRQRLALRPKSA